MDDHAHWEEIRKNEAGATLAEKCAEFGKILGLDGPVEEAVLLAALEDEDYAQKLLVARNAPPWLKLLLAAPPALRDTPPAPQPGQHSTLKLISRASRALLRWSRTGFLSTSQERLLRRENACLSCHHLRLPETGLQKIAVTSASEEPGKRTGGKVCNLCGCVVARKMVMPTAECPDPDPTRPGYTRWGEQIGYGGVQ